MKTLSELASVFRSKNAQPFLTTFDIQFPNKETYQKVKASEAINEYDIAQAYKIPEEAVYGIFWIDGINTVKITIYKYMNGKYLSIGDPELSDMFGAQQHGPLLSFQIEGT